MFDPTITDNLLRGVAVGGFATAGIALAFASVRAPARWIGSFFFLAVIGHVLDNDPALRGPDGHAGIAFWILSALGPASFWAFTVTLFTDDDAFPRLGPLPFLLALTLAAATRLSSTPAAFSIAYVSLSALLVLHAFFVIARGWQGDLVEQRRRLRTPVLVAGALYVLIMATGDFGDTIGIPLKFNPLFQSGTLAFLAVAGALVLLRVDPILLGAPKIRVPAAPPAADDPALSRLMRALDEEEIWRRENLTVGALAKHLAVPEHRLRRLINGQLGYRNFAALVNERRIAAAKTELSAPARKPVSTIAYDLGFGSLGPFNRAFKQATGVTPTAWRQNPTSPRAEILAES